MNLPSSTASPPHDGPNGLPRHRPSHPPITTKAHDLPHPVINTAVAMTVTPASDNIPTSSGRSSPLNHLRARQTQPVLSSDHASDLVRSPETYPSPMASSLPPHTPRRTVSERSPSPQTRTPGAGALAEAMGASKSPGLIRRFSRGAQQRLRRRTSHQNTLRMRDLSAGPVLFRRRSDSNQASDFGPDVSDLELDHPADDMLDDPPYPSAVRERQTALGISTARTSSASSVFEGGIAPAISALLQDGTWLTKLTNKNKRKRLKLWLDPNSARVCWHQTNLAKSFFIDDVQEVRVGAESRNARDEAHITDEEEPRLMTIVYEPPQRSEARTIKTFHILMDSEPVVAYWTEALSTVTRERTEIMNALALSTEKSERGMAIAWRQVMSRKGRDGGEKFTMDDASYFCRKLEINCSTHAVETHFRVADRKRMGSLNYAEYQDFVNSFKERHDVQRLFTNLTMGSMQDRTLDEFLSFMKTDQGIDVDKDPAQWEAVFDKFARPAQNRAALPDAAPARDQRTLSAQGLQTFLGSGYNPALVAAKNDITLDRPLNEYFVSSSHNTYLLSRQVAGTSSIEGYIVALIKGCRCVEIDCWDGDGGRPIVTHGRTMTSKVSFEDCIRTIEKYAFHSSPYPLIVSLEVHCNAEQQKAMADLMLRHWKDKLITEPIMPNAVSLPTPEELRNKILVKVKAAEDLDFSQMLLDASNGRSRTRSLSSAFTRTSSVDKQSVTSMPYVTSSSTTITSEASSGYASPPRASTTSIPPSSSADDSDDMTPAAEPARKRKTSKIIPELGRLGVYAQGIKFSSFGAPELKTPNHILSFSENTFEKRTQEADSKALLEKHNMRYLMRVYPAGRRIDSSNFNPLRAWCRGVQMAALNWQTYDIHQQINQAMFATGADRLGYVLKPEELRHAKHLPIADMIPEASAAEKKEDKGKKEVKFTIDIISAQRLPRPRNHNPDIGMNPYIVFEVYTAEERAAGLAQIGTETLRTERSPLRMRTKIVPGNGFDPQFHCPIAVTLETSFPSLVFLRWTVMHAPDPAGRGSNHVLLASFTAKLASLNRGYRHLPLFNPHGEQYRDAKLFVRVRKEPLPPFQALALKELQQQREEQEHNGGGGGGAALSPASAGTGPSAAPSSSPRPEPVRADRSWRSRVFGRASSQQRRAQEDLGALSRTSSMERELG